MGLSARLLTIAYKDVGERIGSRSCLLSGSWRILRTATSLQSPLRGTQLSSSILLVLSCGPEG